MRVGYGERVRVQFDIEHSTELVEFCIKNLDDSTTERKFVYPDISIEKLARSFYAAGESYIFTTPPMNKSDEWEISCAYQLSGATTIAMIEQLVTVEVRHPHSSTLKADVDGSQS